ncbi:MAG: formyltransferase family protein [Gammaproteobacteria bacterium]|nr:formyltransferase family protein [Gammaproteobacteria bacterium]
MKGTPPAGSRTVLLGTTAPFSSAVFAQLVDAGVEFAAVAVDGAVDTAPIVTVSVNGHRETLPSLAAARGVPVRAAPRLDDGGFLGWLADLAPDFLLVACFGQRLPAAVRAAARSDCLNLHPSLLPRYRGPAPLFWQLRRGETATGVSLHRVGPGIDTGPIVARAPLAFEDGLDGTALAERCAAAGAGLFVASLSAYRAGTIRAVAQDPAQAESQPAPAAGDFRLSAAWPARRIFNFMRGTGHWGQDYPIAIDGRDFLLREALGWSSTERLRRSCELRGRRIRVRCDPGVLEARLA